MTDRGHAPWEILVGAVEARRYGTTSGGPAEGGAQAGDATADDSIRTWSDHIASCTTCRDRMREIDEVMASIQEGDAGDAPEVWIEKARRRTVPASYLEPLRGDFVADIVFDSAHQRLAGTRAGSLENRQLLFAWNRLEVELSVGASDAGSPWKVSGQIFAHEGAPIELGGCQVVLIEGERELDRARTSASGEFLIGTRPRARFRLSIEGDGWTLQTPDIEP